MPRVHTGPTQWLDGVLDLKKAVDTSPHPQLRNYFQFKPLANQKEKKLVPSKRVSLGKQTALSSSPYAQQEMENELIGVSVS